MSHSVDIMNWPAKWNVDTHKLLCVRQLKDKPSALGLQLTWTAHTNSRPHPPNVDYTLHSFPLAEIKLWSAKVSRWQYISLEGQILPGILTHDSSHLRSLASIPVVIILTDSPAISVGMARKVRGPGASQVLSTPKFWWLSRDKGDLVANSLWLQ